MMKSSELPKKTTKVMLLLTDVLHVFFSSSYVYCSDERVCFKFALVLYCEHVNVHKVSMHIEVTRDPVDGDVLKDTFGGMKVRFVVSTMLRYLSTLLN